MAEMDKEVKFWLQVVFVAGLVAVPFSPILGIVVIVGVLIVWTKLTE